MRLNKYLSFVACFVFLFTATLLAEKTQDQGQLAESISVFRTYQSPVHKAIQKELRNTNNWQGFLQRNGKWQAEFDELTQFPRMAIGKGIVVNHEGSAEEKAMHFVETELSGFDLPLESLKLDRSREGSKFFYVDYKQTFQGVEIYNSSLHVRLTKDNKVVKFNTELHKDVIVNTIPSLDMSTIEDYAGQGLNFEEMTYEFLPELKILAIPHNDHYEYKLVHEGHVKGYRHGNLRGNYFTLIDAHDGTIYYRYNKVHNCGDHCTARAEANAAAEEAAVDVSVTVEASVIDNANLPAEVRGLPFVEIEVDGQTFEADVDGMFTWDGDEPIDATVYLQGPYCRVRNVPTGNSTPSFDITLEPGENVISFDGDANDKQISAYYHTNNIWQFMRSYCDEDFDDMDVQFQVFIDTGQDDPANPECNAFYNGNLNFYDHTNTECHSFALFSDIIYHEYGHGINYDYYNHHGANFNNGALGEGYADIWALGLTGYGVLSEGYLLNDPTSNVRIYTEEPKVYPFDLVGEVHADGEIIAGAWWDFGQELGSIDEMMQIFEITNEATLTGADGTEGVLYRDILWETLLVDDDDGDVSNGTPNYSDIIYSFGRHGIFLVGDVSLEHDEVETADKEEGIIIEAEIDIAFPEYFNMAAVYYRTNDDEEYTMVEMENISGDLYEGVIPEQEAGTIIDYYVVGLDEADNVVNILPNRANRPQPNIPYQIMVGYNSVVREFMDDAATTWDSYDLQQEGAEAITGDWEFGDPAATVDDTGFTVQPGSDHTASFFNTNEICAYTGDANGAAGVGAADVDNGAVVLETTPYDLTEYYEPAISYFRWFSNASPTSANPGNDPLTVLITNDGENWVPVEQEITDDASWRMVAFKVADYVEPNESIQMQFIASDSLFFDSGLQFDGGSLVEAAIDDFWIWEVDSTTESTNTSISDLAKLDLNTYPNPANNLVYISPNTALSGQTFALEVFDALGRSIYREESLDLSTQAQAIRCDAWDSGIYFLTLSDGDTIYREKIVVQHRK